MKPFLHIITTRFNVPTQSWNITRDGKAPLSEEWHEHRFEVFRKFTLPSFKNQNNQDFVWLVFFDVNTDLKYKKVISIIQKDYPKFIPVFINEFAQMQPWIINFIKTKKEQFQFVITSDIDNDDLLHKKFTQTVQQYFKPVHDLVIDVRTGIQLEMNGKNAKVFSVNMAASPFVSLVEEINEAGSVIKEPYHSKYRIYNEYSFFDREALFIQFVHPFNMVNNIRADNKRLYGFDYASFGMTAPLEFTISSISTFIHNTKRNMRLAHNKILRKLKSNPER
ncbi:glycosyltransferase [Kaistella sp.]|uniref:glycosyltransferase n=1 Tax=Kaistella sp. TaxID=2782235 RepID=UPI002F950BE4